MVKVSTDVMLIVKNVNINSIFRHKAVLQNRILWTVREIEFCGLRTVRKIEYYGYDIKI